MRTSAVLLAAVLFTPGLSQAGETGNYCVQDYQPAVGTCIANDVRVSALEATQVLEGCADGDPTSALVELDAWIESLTTRYDIGIFLALDGGDARTGDGCLHDYLAPVNPVPGVWNPDHGPWLDLDSDACGDFQSPGAGLHATKGLDAGGGIRIACVDTDGDGFVDASVCTSWDTTTLTACSSVQGAYPLTGSRCSCSRLPVQGLARGPAPGNALGVFVAGHDATTLSLGWGGSCSPADVDYAVYEGVLGDFTSHVPVSCSTGGTGVTVPLPSGNRYYLVVPRSLEYEGSYGKSSAGVQRPPSGQACAPQYGFASCAL